MNNRKKATRYKVAAVQASPVFLDVQGTLEKGVRLIEEAAGAGASLVVFPETWIPGYPFWTSGVSQWNHPPSKKTYARLYRNSVDVPGTAVDVLCRAAKKTGSFVVMGINERTQSGTIYNSMVFISPREGLLGKHRKLVPTYHERLVWGQGDGSTLNVFDTPLGKIGGLVCWEHWMPLARYSLYEMGEQVHASLWPTASETFHIACRNMAFEGRLFVIVACSYLTKKDLPPDFELKDQIAGFPEALSRGGSAIIGPDARYLAGPVYDQETVLYADIDLDRIIEEKQALDVVGHYSRPDVFRLQVVRPDAPAV